MDITFKTPEGTFNYRACAVMLHGDKILAMRDDRSPYYYLPGGRVGLGETAEAAVLREVREELAVEGKILRPLWLNQGFFREDVSGENYHELCLYFLVDVSETGLMDRGESFTWREGKRKHWFSWLSFAELEDAYFYPLFLKKAVFDLPKALQIRCEYE